MKTLKQFKKILTPAMIAVTALLLVAGAANASEVDITFNTFPTDVTFNGVTMPGTGLGTGALVGTTPGSTGWSWNYDGNPLDQRSTAVYTLSWQASGFTPEPSGAWNNNTIPAVGTVNGINSFNGYWYLYFPFYLPANATNVAVHFYYIDGDDRPALLVNGNLIGGYHYSGNVSADVAPMLGWNGVTDIDYTGHVGGPPVTGPAAPLVTNQADFNIGGENYLEFWINNTDSSWLGALACPLQGSGDATTLVTAGYISYDIGAVPIPPSALLLGSALLGLAGWRKLRKR